MQQKAREALGIILFKYYFLLIEYYAVWRVFSLSSLPFYNKFMQEEGEKELSDILGRGQNAEYNCLQLSSRSAFRKNRVHVAESRGGDYFFLYSVPYVTKPPMEILSCDR